MGVVEQRPVTDDVDAPTVVDTPTGAAPPPSGNGTGGPGGRRRHERVRPARRQLRSAARSQRSSSGRVLIVAAIVIAIVIKTFLFQAFYIPSASMDPTLEVGDRVLVNKLSYDLHDVHRGDIVVFEAGPHGGGTARTSRTS